MFLNIRLQGIYHMSIAFDVSQKYYHDKSYKNNQCISNITIQYYLYLGVEELDLGHLYLLEQKDLG